MHLDLFQITSTISRYARSGRINCARKLFDEMSHRDTVTWNAMLTGYSQGGLHQETISLFRYMRIKNTKPDDYSFTATLSACGAACELPQGTKVHASVIVSGFQSSLPVSWNAIIDAHMKVGDTQEALRAFQQAPQNNIISWTSMITGYTQNGHGDEALCFFVGMVRNGVQPDDFAFGAVLHSCSNLAVIGHGKMVHGCIIHSGFQAYVYVGNGLINMYAKCGDIEGSNWAFNEILNKDLISWNAMLFGFGLHGRASQALLLYEEMMASGVKSDKVTFIGLLMTCSHLGLIEKGRLFFETMSSVYGIPHEIDHVTCMVDMLCRGGFLAEATELVNKYTGVGNAKSGSSEALLGACYLCGDLRLGTHLGKAFKILEPQKEMGYVVLSNLYCANGQWKEAEIIRKAMLDKGVKKMPGCSWIEVRNEVVPFVAGSHSNPYLEDICKILHCLEFEMRSPFFIGFKN